MRIIQVLPTMSYGDAIGNDTLAIDRTIRKMGYRTGIYCESRDQRIPTKVCKEIDKAPKLREEDILIYHLSIGTDLNYEIAAAPCRKIIIYHNITPPDYFHDINSRVEHNCRIGRSEAAFLGEYADYCLADSEYNKSDLVEMGYRCPIDVLPILIPLEDYEADPDKSIISRYENDGYVNVLFVGRIAPNKKHEDIIAAFHYYQKYFNKKSRIFLVGSYEDMERYYLKLQSFANQLGVENVYFTGKVPFGNILAYYRIADLFVCMSEHEGFCVPLVEAMKFNVPIIAYNSTAIGETLGGAGILLDDKSPLTTAGVMHHVLENESLRQTLERNAAERLNSFSHEAIEHKLVAYLEGFING